MIRLVSYILISLTFENVDRFQFAICALTSSRIHVTWTWSCEIEYVQSSVLKPKDPKTKPIFISTYVIQTRRCMLKFGRRPSTEIVNNCQLIYLDIKLANKKTDFTKDHLFLERKHQRQPYDKKETKLKNNHNLKRNDACARC